MRVNWAHSEVKMKTGSLTVWKQTTSHALYGCHFLRGSEGRVQLNKDSFLMLWDQLRGPGRAGPSTLRASESVWTEKQTADQTCRLLPLKQRCNGILRNFLGTLFITWAHHGDAPNHFSGPWDPCCPLRKCMSVMTLRQQSLRTRVYCHSSATYFFFHTFTLRVKILKMTLKGTCRGFPLLLIEQSITVT